jgi:hypothetical protein
MSEQDLFNGLIATYRELNMKVRPLAEERLILGRSGKTVRDVIKDMRDDELRFSQALKERLTGTAMADVLSRNGELPEFGLPTSENSTVEVISEFGTARESTLAMLRGMAPEAWDDQSFGPVTIRDAADALLANDAEHMEKIVGLLGSPAAN